LQRLDKTIARRIVRRLNWLAANLDNINRERLTGEFLDELFNVLIGVLTPSEIE
jgi:hypothetical protein